MILKFQTDPDEVYLVEATGNGVQVNRWFYLRKHIGFKKFYRNCIFRHIECERNDEMVERLQLFLSEVVGLKYGITPKKLLKLKTERLDKKDKE
jgi:hypothetical protein